MFHKMLVFALLEINLISTIWAAEHAVTQFVEALYYKS